MKERRACLALFFLISSSVFVPVQATQPSSHRAILESKYSSAHSLAYDYGFDPRDGWQSINITNLEYKYRRQASQDSDGASAPHNGNDMVARRTTKNPPNKSDLGDAIARVLNKVLKGMKGVGSPEPVIITWYTGHDLKNPSCWADGKWAPTDESFACALTLEGWTNRPKCFNFLEVCNGPKKCVFVRVVDTCAGCSPGSKHVDLTRAAFGQLADFDVGILKVKFRPATPPKFWSEKLWGPKVDEK